MRLTILINGPDPAINHDYALLCLDMDKLQWSREAHSGVDLPEWGELNAFGGRIVLTGSSEHETLCILNGLQISRRGEISNADGVAFMSNPCQPKTTWHWRLQAVDRTKIRAENALLGGKAQAGHQEFRHVPS